MTAPILTDLSPAALLRAIEANSEGSDTILARLPGIKVSEASGVLRLVSGIPHPAVNGVLRAHLDAGTAGAAIAETLAYFRFVGLPMVWLVAPSHQPAGLPGILRANGMKHMDTLTGMAADLTRVPQLAPIPAGALVEEVLTDRQLGLWAQTASAGFNLPMEVMELFASLSPVLGYGAPSPLRSFLATLDGRPAGTSTLYLGAGVAGLRAVTVLPHARRQGLGAALTIAPLNAARALGYRIGVLLASHMGIPLYQRLGFQTYGKFELFTNE